MSPAATDVRGGGVSARARLPRWRGAGPIYRRWTLTNASRATPSSCCSRADAGAAKRIVRRLTEERTTNKKTANGCGEGQLVSCGSVAERSALAAARVSSARPGGEGTMMIDGRNVACRHATEMNQGGRYIGVPYAGVRCLTTAGSAADSPVHLF